MIRSDIVRINDSKDQQTTECGSCNNNQKYNYLFGMIN
jgi:hypothetical protein